MKSPLITIITPCYNNKKTIQDTISSVLQQTYPYWEMLIIDDCSTDGSDSIIQEFCKHDTRIKYLKTDKPSGSPSLPRNIGLDNAQGNYICFLDADDCWFPKKLEEQLDFIEKHHYSFVYSNYEKMSSEGVRNNRIIKTKSSSDYYDNLKTCEIPCLTTFIKKDLIQSSRFRDIKKEDYVFWLEILKKNKVTAYNTNQIHALYRESKQSRSGNKIKMIKAQWYVIRQVEKINIIKSIYYTITFLWYGFKKYIR